MGKELFVATFEVLAIKQEYGYRDQQQGYHTYRYGYNQACVALFLQIGSNAYMLLAIYLVGYSHVFDRVGKSVSLLQIPVSQRVGYTGFVG